MLAEVIRANSFLSLGVFLSLCGCASVTYPPSGHCDGSRFFNTDPRAREVKGLGAVLRWKLTSKAASWPRDPAPSPALSAALPAAPPQAVRVTMINHATLLVELPGLTVLTDPVYAERASPLRFVGPRRYRPPGVAMEHLPAIDVIVVSHNHYDHLDIDALRALWVRDRPRVFVPLGTARLLRGAGIAAVTELDWWQVVALAPGQSVMLTEAQHWSARGIFDRNRALWGGYVLAAGGLRVFFAGDTGYSDHFRRVRQRVGPIDVALLPIGAYEPRWFMHTEHMNPDDAVRAHLDLQARQSVGMHFGTFQLTDEAIDAPVDALAVALAAHQVAPARFVAPQNGQSVVATAAPSPAAPASVGALP